MSRDSRVCRCESIYNIIYVVYVLVVLNRNILLLKYNNFCGNNATTTASNSNVLARNEWLYIQQTAAVHAHQLSSSCILSFVSFFLRCGIVGFITMGFGVVLFIQFCIFRFYIYSGFVVFRFDLWTEYFSCIPSPAPEKRETMKIHLYLQILCCAFSS